MLLTRSCGVILHITSLPSPYGIGDLGPGAFRFADFLNSAAIANWQILPLNYTEEGSGFSPYSGLSAFAGNTLLISPEVLQEEGLLSKKDLGVKKPFEEAKVDYPKVFKHKKKLLEKAFLNFQKQTSATLKNAFENFCLENESWLEDYAAYISIKEYFDGKVWSEWPADIKNRKAESLANLKGILNENIEKEKFLQFTFFKQWNDLKNYCSQKGIKFIGDIPFYVGYDSADVWSNPAYFKLDDQKKPMLVAGVPPDYFSETGQLWGMPIFDWDNLKRDSYSWWMKRIDQNVKMFDIVRLDHFRAFSAYWEVPAEEDTAVNGSWTKGPGQDFFKLLQKKHADLPVIAEDLGEIDQPVRDIMAAFNLPGMRVLQFAFGEDIGSNIHIPHNHISNCIVYTGTHDNNTTRGWFENDLSPADRKRLSKYLNKEVKKHKVADSLIRLALQSVAQLAVFPVQDILGLGQEAIMNKPSTVGENWSWRLNEALITPKVTKHLRSMIELYGRDASENSEKKVKASFEKRKALV